jgi:DNA-binding MarR family transcriptional regulator
MKHSSAVMNCDSSLVNTTTNLREKLHEALSMLEDFPVEDPSAMRPHSRKVKGDDIRAILKARRSRSQFFPENLFADPAWDILLELYAAELGQRRISVTSLCIGAAVPATTALRWINALEKAALLTRRNDPLDGRRIYVNLSQAGFEAMDAYFAGAGAPSAI